MKLFKRPFKVKGERISFSAAICGIINVQEVKEIDVLIDYLEYLVQPDYIGTTALAKALDYVSALGVENVATHEHELTQYAMQRLKEIDGMRIFGEAGNKSSVISFLVGNIHHLDMGTLLDRLGIAVRTGHHCAQPLMIRMGIEGTVRASFGLYNTKEEIDVLAAGIERVSRMF